MELDPELGNIQPSNIEPCRACGIFYSLDPSLIQPIFNNSSSDKSLNMLDILTQLSAWRIEVKPSDGHPQYICVSCMNQFEIILNFKKSCLEAQEQFAQNEYQRLANGTLIKKEIGPPEQICGFVYIDSDDEFDGEEDGSTRVQAAFDIPHVPIKEEHMARVPQEFNEKPLTSVVSLLKEAEIETVTKSLAEKISMREDSEDEDDIIKFTYDDDAATLPTPIMETPKTVICKLCSHVSQTQDLHEEHISRVHMLKDCECHICGKRFSNASESRFKFHMKFHKLNKHLKCPVCGFFCISKDVLKEHKAHMHTRVKCRYCNKKMKPTVMPIHLKTHMHELQMELTQKQITLERKSLHNSSPKESTIFSNKTENVLELQGYLTQTEEVRYDKDISAGETLDHNHSYETFNESSSEINTSAASAVSHQETITKTMFKCTACEQSFDLKIKLNKHLKSHRLE